MLIFAVFCHCYRNFISTLFNPYGDLMSITETISAIPTHLSIQREEVLRIIEQEDFPCVFARKAASTHKLFWLFLNKEWQQYQLIEPGSLVLNTCPLHMKKEQK